MAADLLTQQQSAFIRSQVGRGSRIFLYAAIGIFTLVLVATGGVFVLARAEEARKEQFIEQNKIKEESLRPELLNQITLLDRRLRGVRALLTNHIFASNVFQVIEKNTLPQVRFSNFNFGADGLKADMTGEAASYSMLAKQIGIFERDPQIERAEFGGLSATSEGIVGFKISLTFKSTLLHLRQ